MKEVPIVGTQISPKTIETQIFEQFVDCVKAPMACMDKNQTTKLRRDKSSMLY